MKNREGYKGVGRRLRRQMLRLWRKEGAGLSLKEWARQAQLGDAALVWLEHKRSLA